ncbi:glycosyltransferase [Paenibacillus doosanensis]|uniref:tetratricopeptide repeat-containing glycosyltransferase family 2 protein n=1 Tax=Paenibacillus doosanensis TaxID=1229154 RepID=UPI0021801332|nr:glycosyltransferase [Paenibacillus doosanensis]MCS7459583.1 glycosyltransferase [Paenibacillus doosanensis]
MRRNRISLCMIVKDEEEQLLRCLASVQGAVDEIIVVDTGSSDRTAAIARRFGARVIETAWTGDFAAARNAGIDQAAGEWILFLDADEELNRADRSKLRQYVQLAGYDGFFLQIHNYVGSGHQGATINPVLRLFRSDPQHRFEGRIHEQIAEAICRRNPTAAFHITDIVIHHYGYRQEVVVSKDKVRRNIRLLEEAIAAEPENAFYRYNMGVERLRSGQPLAALDSFGEAVRRIDPYTASYAHLLYKYEVRCYQALGRWEEALNRIGSALELFPEYTDLLQYKAVCEKALGRSREAKRSLLQALELGPPPAMYHTEEGMGTFQSAYLLGQLMEEDGEAIEAAHWYTEAIRFKPSLTPPLYRLFHIFRITGREEQIPEWVNRRFAIRSPEALWKVAAIMLQCRCGRALLLLLAADQDVRLPRELNRRIRAEAYMQTGELGRLRSLLNKECKQSGDDRLKALLLRLNWLEGRAVQGRDRIVGRLAGNAHVQEDLAGASLEPEPEREPGLAMRPAESSSSAASSGKRMRRTEGREEGVAARSFSIPPCERPLPKKAAGPLYGANDPWDEWMNLLLAAAQSGRYEAAGHILAAWNGALESCGKAAQASGAASLVRGLAALADRHAAELGRSGMPLSDGGESGQRSSADREQPNPESNGAGQTASSGEPDERNRLTAAMPYQRWSEAVRLGLPCMDGF